MVNFAFCYEKEDELNFVKSEVQKCFKVREIEITVKAYSSAYDFYKSLEGNCPDILFYDIEGEKGMFHEVALAAKKNNPDLVSIVTRNENGDTYPREAQLKPIYTLPSMTKRFLWLYAITAYDVFRKNTDSFSYYVRPDYNRMPINDIMYFVSEGRRTHLVANQFRDTFYQKLDEIEIIIEPKKANFIRIHKSYLVNILFIAKYNKDFVILKNGERLRISRYDYYKLLNKNIEGSDYTAVHVKGVLSNRR